MDMTSLFLAILTYASLLCNLSNAQSTGEPSAPPSVRESSIPSLSIQPSTYPTLRPSLTPSVVASIGPSSSVKPSASPSLQPTTSNTYVSVSLSPSHAPSIENKEETTSNWASDNKGAIIGIALGAGAFLFIIIFMTLRRRRNLRLATYYRPPPFPVQQQEEPSEYGYDTRIDDSSVAVEVMHHGRAY